MSEDKIREELGKVYCGEEWHFLLNYIMKLQQENQQLKDKIKQLEKCYCNRSDCSGRIKDSRKYDSVVQQLDKYKEVIEEVREYVKDACYYYDLENYSSMTSSEVKELLQILDKAKENK